MPVTVTTLLTILVFGVAALYATVGHAGASGYLAAMALFGFAPAVMKPTALVLNIVVASIATYQFIRAGCFRWPTFWPFAVSSIPCAFLGGAMTLPSPLYKQIVGAILLYSAVRLIMRAGVATFEEDLRTVPRTAGITIGAVIGFLSGLTGVGGGIFLSPILLFARWSTPLQASAVAAVFILANSIAGLSGHLSSLAAVPVEAAIWAPAGAAGGWLGAHVGSRKLPGVSIKRFLAAVLMIAAAKMFFA